MTARTDLLPSAIVRHNELKAELLDRFAGLQNDPEALADTVEGLSNLHDVLKHIVWEIRKVARDRDAIKERQVDLLKRARALNEREERLRSLVAHGMSEGGIETLTDVEWSAGLSNAAPKLVIDDEYVIPERFWFQPQPKPLVIDRVELFEAVKAGEEVPGAHLSNGGPTLTIRPKRARKEQTDV